jgi:ketosteroid isomerase-like protein
LAQPRSPREVFLALVNGVAARRWDELPSLYAEQTDVVHPFDPLRAPALRTRDELREHFGGGEGSRPADADPPQLRRVANITIHETTDPEVIVAEFEYHGTAVGTGEPFALPGIFVLRVRNGEIVSSRDYFDHVTAARAQGWLGELVAAVSARHRLPLPACPEPSPRSLRS